MSRRRAGAGRGWRFGWAIVAGLVAPSDPGPAEEEAAALVERLQDAALGDADRRAMEERLAGIVEVHFRASDGDRTSAAPGRLDVDRRRAAVIGLAHLAGAFETQSGWRAAWREPLVVATEWARAEPDRFGDAAMFAYLAATALIDAGEPERAAGLLDPLLGDARFSSAHLQTRLLERRACAARLLGETARALEHIADARRGIPCGEPSLLPHLLAEEFRILMNLGLTDRAARVLDLQEERIVAAEAAGAGIDGSARRVLIANRVRLAYARSRHAEVIRETAALLARLEDDDEHRIVRARLSLYYALSLADLALATGVGMEKAARELDSLLESGRLANDTISERHAIQRRVSVALAAGDLDVAKTLLGPVEPTRALDGPPTLQDVSEQALRSRLRRARGGVGPATEGGSECERFLDGFAAFLESWGRTPIDESGIGFLHYPYRREVVWEALEAALWLAGDDPAGAFELLLRVQAMGTLARRHGIAAPDLATVRRLLIPVDGGVVALVPGPFGSHLFMVDHERVLHLRVAPEGELATALRAMRVHLVAPPERSGRRTERDALLAESRRLADLLFPPAAVERLSDWRSVYVTGVDLVGPMSVEALPVKGLGELGVARAIGRLPSIPLGIWLAEQRTARAGGGGTERTSSRPAAAVFVATRWDAELWPDLGAIPLTGADLETLSGGRAPGRRIDRIGDDATLAGLADLADQDVDRIILVAHGVQDEANVRAGCLLLADGLLSAGEVERTFASKRPPPLVVLAACEGDRAPLRRGDDGVQHLSGAWLSCGASSVAASDRDLDYHASVRLVGKMMEELEPGLGPAEALRRARAALKSDPRFDHPFFYANLHLVGLIDAPR